MKGQIKVLNGSGHSVIEYDTEIEGGTKAADEFLNRELGYRTAFFSATTREQIPGRPNLSEHEDIVAVRPMAGG